MWKLDGVGVLVEANKTYPVKDVADAQYFVNKGKAVWVDEPAPVSAPENKAATPPETKEPDPKPAPKKRTAKRRSKAK